MLVCIGKYVNMNVLCIFSSPRLIPWALLYLAHGNKNALNWLELNRWGENRAEWTGRKEIRLTKFLVADEVHKDIFWPTFGIAGSIWLLCTLSLELYNFYVSGTLQLRHHFRFSIRQVVLKTNFCSQKIWLMRLIRQFVAFGLARFALIRTNWLCHSRKTNTLNTGLISEVFLCFASGINLYQFHPRMRPAGDCPSWKPRRCEPER